MPIDAEIPLGFNSPQANPFAVVGQFAQVQNAINQNRLFQQTFAAKQKMGQILATAPDAESGWDQIMKDPQVAPFAGEALNSWRSAQLAMTQQQGEQQKQATDGFSAFIKMMPSLAADPTQAGNIAASTLKLLSPTAAARVAPAMQDIYRSLTDGLPQDNPAAFKAGFNQRAAAMVLSGGFGPEVNKALYGTPGTQDTGGSIVPTLQLPPQFGPGMVAGPGTLTKTLPPTLTSGPFGEGGAEKPVIMGGAPNALAGPTPNQTGVNPLTGSSPSVPSGGSFETRAFESGPQGPSQAQTEANKAAGKMTGDIQSDMMASQKDLPAAVKRLDMMNDALTHFQAGGGAQFRTSAAKVLQGFKNAGLDIDQKTIDKVGNQDLASSQIFESEVRPQVITELKQAAQGTGRVMRSEVDAFMKMMDSTTDPKALTGMLNQVRYNIAVGHDQANKYVKYKSLLDTRDPSVQGYGPSDFYTWYNNQPQVLPTATGSGINLAPVGGAKGAGTGKPTHRYDPASGRIVPLP